MYTDHIPKRLGSEPLWCRIGTQQHLTNNTLHHVIHLPGLLLLFPPPILHVVDSHPYRADNCTQKVLSLDATAQIWCWSRLISISHHWYCRRMLISSQGKQGEEPRGACQQKLLEESILEKNFGFSYWLQMLTEVKPWKMAPCALNQDTTEQTWFCSCDDCTAWT